MQSKFLLTVAALSLLLAFTATPVTALVDNDLPIFGVSMLRGDYSTVNVQAFFRKFLNAPLLYVVQVDANYPSTTSEPVTATFQFFGNGKTMDSTNLRHRIEAGDQPAIITAMQAFTPSLVLYSINYTMPSTPSPVVIATGAGAWFSNNPEIVAGCAAGLLIIIFIIVIVVVQRRAKRHEAMRETMEAMLGDGAGAGAARTRAPTQTGGKKRAPAPSGGPRRDPKAPGYAPPPTQQVQENPQKAAEEPAQTQQEQPAQEEPKQEEVASAQPEQQQQEAPAPAAASTQPEAATVDVTPAAQEEVGAGGGAENAETEATA